MAKISPSIKALQAERDSIKDSLNRQQESLPAQERIVAALKQDIVTLKQELEQVERDIELLTTGAKPGKNKTKKPE